MNPGPAPVLIDTWVTNQAFWGFLFLAAFAVGLWYATEFLKRMHAASAELDQVLEQGPPPPQPRNCQIYGCHQVGTHLFDRHPTGVFYTCTPHANLVRDWAGPYDRTVEAVYNQELDGIEDYANGEAS